MPHEPTESTRAVFTPEVSIVLPTFNRLPYLRQAVDSVFAQTHGQWELLIADDGSDPETRMFLGSIGDPRVSVILLAHSGNPAAVRNRAIRRARGRYIAFLDSDDLWSSRKLERQLELMRSQRDRRWSYTKISVTDGDGQVVRNRPMERWFPYEGTIVEQLLRHDALVATPTVIAERSLVDEAGGFDEEQRYAEDYELWLRLAMLSEVSVSSEPLTTVRKHSDNYSCDPLAAYQGWVRLYAKMADIVPEPRLRSLCRRRRARNALALAGVYGERRDDALAVRTLVAASIDSWAYPEWWWGALKIMVKRIAPTPARSIYQRLRSSRR